MGLTIKARFVLGAYQGRSPSGQTEEFPGTDRLLAALVAAAGSGPYAEETAEGLKIADRHRGALRWLESHVPKQLKLPETSFRVPDVVAYRAQGLLFKGAYAPAAAKPASARSFLSGPVVWRWDEQPDDDVFQALQELCAEVSHLGEAQSLVVLEASLDDEPLTDALELAPSDELFPRAAVPVSTPLPGRVAVLEAAHEAQLKARRPAERQVAKNESEEIARWPDQSLALLWYQLPTERQGATVPWDRAFVVEVEPDEGTTWPPSPVDAVDWCVALHRAMVRVLDPHVPPLISGHYPPGAVLPANRLAIQVIDEGLPLGFRLSEGIRAGFALLVPHDASPEDQDAVVLALQALADRKVYRGKAGALRVSRVRPIAAESFWRPPAPGTTRWWLTEPLAVAETRPAARGTAGRWTLGDALHLSIGLVHRDLLGLPVAKGNAAFRQVVELVKPQVEVAGLVQVVGRDLKRFVHRMKEGQLVTAYRALLRAPGLLTDTAPVAIGQSRHLGTGLLVPVDLTPDGTGGGEAR